MRGFVTVATGSDYYYQLAANLYLSYKKRGRGQYPFALICDRENEYTALFDRVVLVDDIRRSTIDKLLIRYAPFEEAIFMDADTLIVEAVDDLWDYLSGHDAVTAFGCTLPLDSQKGWFTYEGSGKYKPHVKYLISMNGGIYYVRKSAEAEQMFQDALEIVDHYGEVDFKYFSTPQDEPVMAMAMVLNGFVPRDVAYDMIILPAHKKKVTVDHCGRVYENGQPSQTKMIHFATANTRLFLYNYLNDVIQNDAYSKNPRHYWNMKLRYLPKDVKARLRHFGGAVLRKRGLDKVVEFLKKQRR